MLINPNRIHEIFLDCLFKEGEDHSQYISASGLTISVDFHPERIEKYSDEIHNILLNLPKEFQEDEGGGYTFLNMVLDKENNHCMEQSTAQELLLLSMGSGWADNLLPREVWSALPGGVPYIIVYKERKEVKITKEDKQGET